MLLAALAAAPVLNIVILFDGGPTSPATFSAHPLDSCAVVSVDGGIDLRNCTTNLRINFNIHDLQNTGIVFQSPVSKALKTRELPRKKKAPFQKGDQFTSGKLSNGNMLLSVCYNNDSNFAADSDYGLYFVNHVEIDPQVKNGTGSKVAGHLDCN